MYTVHKCSCSSRTAVYSTRVLTFIKDCCIQYTSAHFHQGLMYMYTVHECSLSSRTAVYSTRVLTFIKDCCIQYTSAHFHQGLLYMYTVHECSLSSRTAVYSTQVLTFIKDCAWSTELWRNSVRISRHLSMDSGATGPWARTTVDARRFCAWRGQGRHTASVESF